ncbi:DUF4056 domain-containing protein [Erwiniaceae bacterium CAU 1747]
MRFGLCRLLLLLLSVCSTGCQRHLPAATTSSLADLSLPAGQSPRVWLLTQPLPKPDGLRPCCAFGYNLRAKLFGIPVPGYQLDNIVAPWQTGEHHFNPSFRDTLTSLIGLNNEHNGLVYTHRAGFIDLAHLRDSADNTLWLFSHIWPRMGLATTLKLDDELGQREIRLFAFTPPADASERYRLAVYLAAHLAFELAAWHEVAQWYGFESVPGYSEGVSAFSPEDLYSNLLGTRVAIDLLNAGDGASLPRYQQAMSGMIPQALAQLQAESPAGTRFRFDMLDRLWWNSRCRLPDKFLLRYRNYDVSERRWPSRAAEGVSALWLTLPDRFHGQALAAFGRLEILPGHNMTNLPAPVRHYLFSDFPALAQHAKRADLQRLAGLNYRCN